MNRQQGSADTCSFSVSPFDKCGKPAVTAIYAKSTGRVVSKRCAKHAAHIAGSNDYEARSLSSPDAGVKP